MNDTGCSDFLAALALGEEGDGRHLQACPACGRAVTLLGGALRDLARDEVHPPSDVDARSRAVVRGPGSRSSLPPSAALALAALAFGGLVGGARLGTGGGAGSVLLLVTAYLWISVATTVPVLLSRRSAGGFRGVVRP